MDRILPYKPPLDELSHSGVKGMKWGVRNARPSSSGKAKLTPTEAAAAAKRFGDRGVNRINKRLRKGETVDRALKTETHIKTAKTIGLVVYGVIVAKNLIKRFGPSIASSIISKRGAKAAADILADSRGLTKYSAISLTFNAAKNLWE
jgi:hypothetical protein